MALGKLKEKKGQSYANCCFHGCDSKGRVLARLGNTEVAYCAYHRKKYGERVLNALINARFNGKLSKFLLDTKSHLFMNSNSHLCESCQAAEKKYIESKVHELDALAKEAERYNISTTKETNTVETHGDWEFEDEEGK